MENHPKGSNGDPNARGAVPPTTARRAARRGARPTRPRGSRLAGRAGRLCGLAPTAAQRAVAGRPHPGAAEAWPRRRSPGPAVHSHMSLRGRRRPAPARRPGRAAQSGGRPTAPSAASRGQHRGDTAPAPAPASRFPRPGRRRLRHLRRTRKSAGGGGGARGRALRLHLAARAPGGTCPPAVLTTGSCCPRPGKTLLPRGSHITTPIRCKLGAQVDAPASLLPVARVVLSETQSRPLLIQECSGLCTC